jgi:hypothetical protein
MHRGFTAQKLMTMVVRRIGRADSLSVGRSVPTFSLAFFPEGRDLLTYSYQSLGLGLYNGVAGLITEPSKGLREEGAVGFAKGLGKGTAGLLTKTTTGMLGTCDFYVQTLIYVTASVGIFAYPAQGIYKSIVTSSNPRLLQEKVATRNGALLYVDDGLRRQVLQRFRQISA